MNISPDLFDKGKLKTLAGLFLPRYTALSRRENLLSMNTKEISKSRDRTAFFRRVNGMKNLSRRGGRAALFILTAADEFVYLANLTEFDKFGGNLLLFKITDGLGLFSISRRHALGVALRTHAR